jgi:hypothetical protein
VYLAALEVEEAKLSIGFLVYGMLIESFSGALCAFGLGAVDNTTPAITADDPGPGFGRRKWRLFVVLGL